MRYITYQWCFMLKIIHVVRKETRLIKIGVQPTESKFHICKEITLKLDYSVSKVTSNLNFILKLWRDDEQHKWSGNLFQDLITLYWKIAGNAFLYIMEFSSLHNFLINDGDSQVLATVHLICSYSFLQFNQYSKGWKKM